ncbi:SRPBCC family protein [Alphaproteobacteria bacterium KMM 3653]|uniref:SRPBCC family protein n=1 Tax=Harenicola maris TaxID=2841044 RepID=A0AAP2CVA1_9RHOB|nr:SRPBCC family protein [Harenicola maris]
MQFTAREDIAAPIDRVFEAVTDYASFEKQVLRRGAQVRRATDMAQPGVGMTWELEFRYRGRPRALTAQIVQFEAPNGVTIEGRMSGLSGEMRIDLIALSKQRTRMDVTIDLKPQSITARVLVQSLRLARTSLTQRFNKRLSDFAKGIEDQVA